MAKMEEDPGIEGAPEWITTFVDMISLLVTFFILLFTFSSMDDFKKFRFPQNILGKRSPIESQIGSNAVDGPPDDLMTAIHPETGAADIHSRPPEAMVEQLEPMGQKLSEGEIEFDLSSARDEIVVHFDEDAAFAPGSIQVTAGLRRSLEQLADVLQHYPNSIVVEGHTDAGFKESPRYPTAEALSCARAVSAARVLMAKSGIDATRVRVAGLGSTRPRNNNTTAIERTRNRRVEVRILPPEHLERRR